MFGEIRQRWWGQAVLRSERDLGGKGLAEKWNAGGSLG